MTYVTSFPQSYFSWCHYRINTFVTRQQSSTRDKMFFGNHYKSFSHLTHMPNETNLSVKSYLVIAWNSTCITLHNMMILRFIKAIFRKFSSCSAYLRMLFKRLQKLIGSTESKIKLHQNFPTKNKNNPTDLKDFFPFLKKDTTGLLRTCKQILQAWQSKEDIYMKTRIN